MYRPRKQYSVLAILSRGLAKIFGLWPFALIFVLYWSPVSPHLRWEYTYREVYGARVYIACTYLGAQGFVTPYGLHDCPVIAMLDARDWR